MKHIIHVFDDAGVGTAFTAPLGAVEKSYLQKMTASLRPLSDEDYMTGPAAIIQTAARFSYVVVPEDRCVYWIIEWEPGTLLVQFNGESELAWTGILHWSEYQSEEAVEAQYGIHPQYTLVFGAWDAQFDEAHRMSSNFIEASSTDRAAYVAAFERVNELGEEMARRFNEGYQEWMESSIGRMKGLVGEGHRVD